jgi:FtsP/CotA-like multicopper oxidase with cupredoxin domain
MSRNARIGVAVGAVVVIAVALVIVLATSGSDSARDKATASITVDKTGRANGGLKHITVKKGGTVDLTVTTAIPDEVHLHGYDLEKEARAGKPVRFNFKANMDGVFEVEVHKPTDNQIAELEVKP